MDIDKTRIILIIGLPGSGKTTWSQKYIKDHIIYDDFISYFYKGDILESIKNKQKVCLIDPRLCLPNVFDDIIKQIEEIIDREEIGLILFENEPDKCLKNKYMNCTLEYSKYYELLNYGNRNTIILSIW